MATRKYTAGVRAALISFSAGTCYWPSCGRLLLDEVDGKYFIDLDIAHICAVEKGGPRYEESMTAQQRNDLPNVMFLCRKHHKAIDANNGEDYSVETLREWKDLRETPAQAALRAKSPVTYELLENYINTAMVEQNERIENTLNRLEANDVEAALVMRELLDELKIAHRNRAVIDPDSAAMLSNAARKLTGLEDSANMLSLAADKLSRIPEWADQLHAAANKMSMTQGIL